MENKADKIAGLTRKEFIALPMEERHRRLKEQAEQFVKEHGYLIQPKPITTNLEERIVALERKLKNHLDQHERKNVIGLASRKR